MIKHAARCSLRAHRGTAQCPSPPAQIKPAVLRNVDKYSAVLLKPWYSSAEQEWTSGAHPGAPRAGQQERLECRADGAS